MYEYDIFEAKDFQLLKKHDNMFLSFANNYDWEEWYTASLIDSSILEKCGYYHTMPHQLTMVSKLDLEGITKNGVTEVKQTPFALIPAACLHIYPQLTNKIITNKIITTFAKVYRNEDGNFNGKGRLWEFWVREFVAVGDRDFVKNFLNDFERKAVNYAIEEFGSAQLVNACDLFFPTRENVLTQKIQKKNNLKKELIIDICGSEVACASFNYHKFHFSKTFQFDNDSNVETACVGFGLNRWVLASKQQ